MPCCMQNKWLCVCVCVCVYVCVCVVYKHMTGGKGTQLGMIWLLSEVWLL
jgi:hypothetical protein